MGRRKEKPGRGSNLSTFSPVGRGLALLNESGEVALMQIVTWTGKSLFIN
jgi:hypothetical protein